MDLKEAVEACDRAVETIRGGDMTDEEYGRLQERLEALQGALDGPASGQVRELQSRLKVELARAHGYMDPSPPPVAEAEALVDAALEHRQDGHAWIADLKVAMAKVAGLERKAPRRLRSDVGRLLTTLELQIEKLIVTEVVEMVDAALAPRHDRVVWIADIKRTLAAVTQVEKLAPQPLKPTPISVHHHVLRIVEPLEDYLDELERGRLPKPPAWPFEEE